MGNDIDPTCGILKRRIIIHLAPFSITSSFFFIVLFLLKLNKLEPTNEADSTDFYRLVANDTFVDKTLMIEDFLKISDKFPRITRPRGWGKTINLNMIKKFLEIELDEDGEPLPDEKRVNRNLFAGGEIVAENKTLKPLKIAAFHEAMKSQGQHPVIYVSFDDVTGITYQEIESKMKNLMAKLFVEHRYLLKNLDGENSYNFKLYTIGKFEKVALKYSLKLLSDLLGKRFDRHAFVLVDDYDTPTNHLFASLVREIKAACTTIHDEEAIMKAAQSETLQRVQWLVTSVLSSCFINNNGTSHGLISGIFDIDLQNLIRTKGGMINNDRQYNLLDKPFSDFYGFDDTELDVLLQKGSCDVDREEIKSWYGYIFAGSLKYNPWSIRHFLANKCQFDDYWILSECGVTSVAGVVLLSDSMQEELQRLIDGEIVKDEICSRLVYSDVTADTTVLAFSGFLSVISYGYNASPEVSVPNREITNILQDKLMAWVCNRLQVTAEYFASTAKSLTEFDIAKFNKMFSNLLSAFPEFAFPSYAKLLINRIMKCLAYSLADEYQLEKNSNASTSTSTVVLICKAGECDQALNIDYCIMDDPEKLQSHVENELDNIDPRSVFIVQRYPHVKQVLKIILAFYGKEYALGFKKFIRRTVP